MMTQSVDSEFAIRAKLYQADRRRPTDSYPKRDRPLISAYRNYTLNLAYAMATAGIEHQPLTVELDSRFTTKRAVESVNVSASICEQAGYPVPSVNVVYLIEG